MRNLAGLEANEWLIIKAGALPPLVALLLPLNAPKAREHAAGALANLAFTQRHHAAISQAGAVEALVELLDDHESATPEARECAADALSLLAASPEIKSLLVQLDCHIEPAPHLLEPRMAPHSTAEDGEQTTWQTAINEEEEPLIDDWRYAAGVRPRG